MSQISNGFAQTSLFSTESNVSLLLIRYLLTLWFDFIYI